MVQAYRATQEERVLKEAFPEYESYMAQAGRFTPRVTTTVGAQSDPGCLIESVFRARHCRRP